MTNQPITESGMTFGPYPDGHCFFIEKSRLYQCIQDHVQMVEFLLLKNNRDGEPNLWVVEAKSSSPRPDTRPNFEEFIVEIRDKLVNAVSLTIAAFLGRHGGENAEIPGPFQEVDLANVGVKLVLVINGHRNDWLPPLQEAVQDALRATIKTWSFGPNSVAVINDEGAKRHGLILNAEDDNA